MFHRILDRVIHDFGVSGKLGNSDLVMWNRQTESGWQQFTSEAIAGELTGKKLTFLPPSTISRVDFKTANPEGQALSRDTGFNRFLWPEPLRGLRLIRQPTLPVPQRS